MTTGFWDGEVCEVCGGPIVERHVTLHRQVKGNYYLFENVPAYDFSTPDQLMIDFSADIARWNYEHGRA